MAVSYRAINWDPQKKRYDLALLGFVALGAVSFAVPTIILNPDFSPENLIIRTTALLAVTLLHVILLIGPLARLDQRFLPLLYNRRHLGVVMFFLALVHAGVLTVLFHALGNENPIVSIFTSYRREYDPFTTQTANIANFPFEPFGFFALVIFFFMAATSHDFWLRILGASFWKAMHMLVYVAYGLVLVHVFFGFIQSERSIIYPVMLGLGFVAVAGTHIAAWRKEAATDAAAEKEAEDDGYIDAGPLQPIEEGRAKIYFVNKERVAVWNHQGRLFATSNVCRHQGGPIGEGKIVDGCVTCPWHGWNYKPEDGVSPPPFNEKLPTYQLKVKDGRVLIKAEPNALETVCEGVKIDG